MGYKFKDIPYELRIGRDINSVPNLQTTIKDQENSFDFIQIGICNKHNFRTAETIQSRDIALTRPGKSPLHIFSLLLSSLLTRT